jgi:cobalt-zinc-cadmium efflux system outer membrane protein
MVGQVLPITGRRPLEVSAASALVDAASGRASEQVRRLRADVRLAFADLIAAQNHERELIAIRDRLQELAALLARRESAGDAATAVADRARAQAALSGFLITPLAPSVTAVSPSSPRLAVPSVDELMARAEQTRGEISALRHEVDAASFAERAASKRVIPEPEVVAGTKSSNAGSGDIGSVVTVHVPLPLFDRGRPEKAAARARRSQAEAQLEALRTALRSQIASWREAVIQRREAADRYRATAVPASVDLERIAQVSYDAGERGILEVLDAYRGAATARIRQSALDLAVRQAELELEFVSGWEVP